MPRGRPKQDIKEKPESLPLESQGQASRKRGGKAAAVKNEEDAEFDNGTQVSPKKTKQAPRKRKQPHENIVILVDVGSSSDKKVRDDKTALEHSRQIADWILTRAVSIPRKDTVNYRF